MKCLFNLYRECRVVSVVCGNEAFKERCINLTASYASEAFIKSYCSFCIKSLYAKRFKVIKYTVVNTL